MPAQHDCIGLQTQAQPPSLMQGMSSGVLMSPPDIGLGFGANGQGSSSLPLIKGESSVSEYQDCGLSPLFLTGDSRWDSNFEAMSSPHARDKAKMRYNAKKKTRTYVIFLNSFRFCNSWMMHLIISGYDLSNFC